MPCHRPDLRRCLWFPACLALLCAACERAPPPPITGLTMGTAYTLRLAGMPAGISTADLQSLIDQRLVAINLVMSTYDPASELSRINHTTSTDWIDMSPALAEVIRAARRVSEESRGAFDITVAPLVDLWGFGPAGRIGEPPAAARIEALRQRTGIDKIQLRDDPPAIRKARADVHIDLSAIAKGYAVDELALLLESLGVTDYLVEIGGEIRVSGERPGGGRWRVGIERPSTGDRSVQRVIELGDGAIATSGDYRNFLVLDDNRFPHAIDPRTGYPVQHDTASVSVLADTAMRADALATAFLVLGREAGLPLAEQLGLPVLFTVRTDNGLTEIPSPAFETMLGR